MAQRTLHMAILCFAFLSRSSGGQRVAGVIYDPTRDEMFSADWAVARAEWSSDPRVGDGELGECLWLPLS